MYPANFFSVFPAFPRENKVFVAMSFAPQFTKRWEQVISPGIQRIEINGEQLQPVRVDQRNISDSILTEILTGVGRCRLVFGDITSMGMLGPRPMRNDNVLYEVGIAHATRRPEEVILFRSDNDHLMFDVANVRVNHYDPDGDPAGARDAVARALLESLKEVDLTRNLAVQRAVDALDFASWRLLQEAAAGPLGSPMIRTMGDVMGQVYRVPAIQRLLEAGILAAKMTVFTNDLISQMDPNTPLENLYKYELTPFGQAVLKAAAVRMGIGKLDPGLIAKFAEGVSEPNKPEGGC